MEIFKSHQDYFVTLGITRHQAEQGQRFNVKILQSFLVLILLVSLFVGFLFCEANSFKAYIGSIYFTSASITIAFIFVSFIWNVKYFFAFIDGWEKYVEQSLYRRFSALCKTKWLILSALVVSHGKWLILTNSQEVRHVFGTEWKNG